MPIRNTIVYHIHVLPNIHYLRFATSNFFLNERTISWEVRARSPCYPKIACKHNKRSQPLNWSQLLAKSADFNLCPCLQFNIFWSMTNMMMNKQQYCSWLQWSCTDGFRLQYLISDPTFSLNLKKRNQIKLNITFLSFLPSPSVPVPVLYHSGSFIFETVCSSHVILPLSLIWSMTSIPSLTISCRRMISC